MTLHTAVALIAVFALSVAGVAAADSVACQGIPLRQDGRWSLDRLPKGVVGEAGKVTFFADFDHPMKPAYGHRCVPIYVINRTGKPLGISPYALYHSMYLEVKIDGRWARAQPNPPPARPLPSLTHHQVNIRDNQPLASGEFTMIAGYLPDDARHTAPARYRRLHEDGVQAVTNVGKASYRPADAQASKLDQWVIEHEADDKTLRALIDGTLMPSVDVPPNNWQRAMGTRYPAKALAMIRAWDGQDAAKYKAMLRMAGAIAYSPAYSEEASARLYRSGLRSASPKANKEAMYWLALGMGKRLPARAIAEIKAVDPDQPGAKKKIEDLMYGLSISELASMEQLTWALHRSIALGIPPVVANAMGRRFQDEALALRPALRKQYGERATLAIWHLEQYALSHGSAATLAGVVSGRIVMEEFKDKRQIGSARRNLAWKHTAEAERVVKRWRASDDARLRKLAEELELELHHVRNFQSDKGLPNLSPRK